MTDEQLAAIEARVKAATPGPWSRVTSIGSRWWTLGMIRSHSASPLPEANEDADWSFAEHARSDVPALLEEVRKLRGEIDEAGRIIRFAKCESCGAQFQHDGGGCIDAHHLEARAALGVSR